MPIHMLKYRQSDEAVKQLMIEAKTRHTDLETVMVEELVRFLEEEDGIFTDIANSGRVSLDDIDSADVPLSEIEHVSAEMKHLIQQAELLDLGYLDILLTEVAAERTSLHQALSLAFQYGKHIAHITDKLEQQSTSQSPELKKCEAQDLQNERFSRQFRHTVVEQDEQLTAA